SRMRSMSVSTAARGSSANGSLRKIFLKYYISEIPCSLRQDLQNLILRKPAAVQTDIILAEIRPFLIREEFIIRPSLLIHILHHFARAFFFPSCAGSDVAYTEIKGGVDKYGERFVSQDMIGAPSYDNAVAFLRKGENDIPLDLKKHIVHGNRVIFRTDLDLMIYREAPLVGLLLIHTCKLVKWNLLFFAGHFDQFLVIKGITKLI